MPEQFYSLVGMRQSDRGYLDVPVGRQVTERIIEAARLAPSACNAQPWKFIVVDDPGLREKIAESTLLAGTGMNQFTFQAPVLIVIIMKLAGVTSELSSRVKRKHFPLMDIGIAAAHICLAATAEGLGSCMIGWFDEKAVKNLLQIPAHDRPVLIISLGYRSDPQLRAKRRKSLDKILSYNGYSGHDYFNDPGTL